MIHASPPCQSYSRAAKGPSWGQISEVDLISKLRKNLDDLQIPYVIENVEGSPLKNPIKLCGSMFNLKVRRHRIFESTFRINTSNLNCNHKKQGKPIGIYGSMNDTVKGVCSKTGKTVYGGSTAKNLKEAQDAMQINWLGWGDLKEALPPIYTQFIGYQFIQNHLGLQTLGFGFDCFIVANLDESGC